MWSSPEKALEYIYDNYYEMMCNLVYRIIKDSAVSEDIVQDVFLEIWRKRDEIFINSSIEAYLRRSCRNKTLNYIRSNNVHWEDESEQYLAADELQYKINKVISNLPEKCRLVFALSRFEEMSYSDISKELDISVKTVENHISKALKVLRENIYNKEEI